MKVVLLTLLSLAVASAAVLDLNKQRQIGDCVDLCTPGVADSGCSHGHICISNGCGHTCHIILPGKRALCLGAMCNVWCPFGNKVNADGCPVCGCNEAPVDILV
ncbi:unnamed protein product [Lymnaea stagnalis]|uniref:Antistasin-like domain-containing protein n=1 Tax=Lymnaea stagnalis TaxID=6523 RepID=A0AAV2IFC8_LYMST